jgi:hypothetical protein
MLINQAPEPVITASIESQSRPHTSNWFSGRYVGTRHVAATWETIIKLTTTVAVSPVNLRLKCSGPTVGSEAAISSSILSMGEQFGPDHDDNTVLLLDFKEPETLTPSGWIKLAILSEAPITVESGTIGKYPIRFPASVGTAHSFTDGRERPQITTGPCSSVQLDGTGNRASIDCGTPDRSITDDQKKKFIAYLTPSCPFKVSVHSIVGDREGAKFAEQFRNALREAGCYPDPTLTEGLFDREGSFGIWIMRHDQDHEPPGFNALVNAVSGAARINPVTLTTNEYLKPDVTVLYIGFSDAKRVD